MFNNYNKRTLILLQAAPRTSYLNSVLKSETDF